MFRVMTSVAGLPQAASPSGFRRNKGLSLLLAATPSSAASRCGSTHSIWIHPVNEVGAARGEEALVTR